MKNNITIITGACTYGHEGVRVLHIDGEPHTINIGAYCSLASDITIYCGKWNHDYTSVSTFSLLGIIQN